MEPLGQFVGKSEYARMHGWHRSYVSKLQGQGRLVLSPDGKQVDWAASDALIGKTADPSKLGVQQRWASERVEQDAGDQEEGGSTSTGMQAGPGVGATGAADSPFHQARANREHYNGQMAKLEYEWLTGLLVSRPRVEDAAHTIGRLLRDRILGLPPRLAPELAAISDHWELEQRLTAALRMVLDDVAVAGADAMRKVYNDPGRGKLSELAREGRERYGTDRGNTSAS